MPANSSNARPMFIVTHERYIADTLVTILAQHGFTAVAAYRALEAVEKARRMRPWFVLMDFVMPDIDGAQAAIRITREQPDCEVLLYSSQNISIEQLRDAIRQQGCQSEIIPAPIPLSQLLARVRKSAALKGLLPSQNETVLVVDDEHVIADTLAIILEQHGVEAATAYNGKGAIEAARRLRPKLIVWRRHA